MKKIVILLSCLTVASIFASEEPEEADVHHLFGPGVKLSYLQLRNYGSWGSGNSVRLHHGAWNKNGGQISGESEVVIEHDFYNNGGVVKVGDKTLQGEWAVIGDLNFNVDGHVFNEGAVVRGSFSGSSIPKSTLTGIDLKGVDFGTTNVSQSDFSFSDVTNARFENAQITGSDFSCATGLNEQQKTNLKNRGAIVEGAVQNCTTKLEKKLIEFIDNGGSLLFLKRAIESGGNVNVATANGTTLLMLAAKNLDGKPLAEFLINHDANIHAKSQSGETAAMLAAGTGNIDVLQLLLSKGACIEEANSTGITTLHIAVLNGQHEVVKFLIKNGAQINASDNKGVTPLMSAVVTGFEDIVILLLDAGADYTLKTTLGNTALQLARSKQFSGIAENIVDCDLQGSFKKCGNDEACVRGQLNDRLIQAVTDGRPLDVEYYLKRGADINVQSGDHSATPLIEAIEHKNELLVQLLISKNADLETTNKYGDTPLMIAVFNNNFVATKMLLEAGANYSVQNKNGVTASGIAQKNKYNDIAQLLNNSAKAHELKKEL